MRRFGRMHRSLAPEAAAVPTRSCVQRVADVGVAVWLGVPLGVGVTVGTGVGVGSTHSALQVSCAGMSLVGMASSEESLCAHIVFNACSPVLTLVGTAPPQTQRYHQRCRRIPG